MDKRFFGVDSFVGLEESEGTKAGGFVKGMFNNVTLEECKRNLFRSPHLYELTRSKIFIEKFRFSENDAIGRWLRSFERPQFCFVHIDCDLSSSFSNLKTLIRSDGFLAKTAYVLFDDYGCDTNLKNIVDDFMRDMSRTWDVQVHSQTRLTKYFKLVQK